MLFLAPQAIFSHFVPLYIDFFHVQSEFEAICSSDSSPQTKAITNYIKDKLFEEEKIKPWHIEGYESLRWVLMDYVNIIVNIFNTEQDPSSTSAK